MKHTIKILEAMHKELWDDFNSHKTLSEGEHKYARCQALARAIGILKSMEIILANF